MGHPGVLYSPNLELGSLSSKAVGGVSSDKTRAFHFYSTLKFLSCSCQILLWNLYSLCKHFSLSCSNENIKPMGLKKMDAIILYM